MLYLEDFMELIEHLPQEIRESLTNIRELDLASDTTEGVLEKRLATYFSECAKCENEIPVHLKNEFNDIQNTYQSLIDDSDEKISIANHMYEIVEKYLKRLDGELFKFKLELEADNKGITEQLEKRSLQLDEHVFLTPAPVSYTKNNYTNNSFNYSSSSSQQSGQQQYLLQQQQQPPQQQQQQQLRDKENRQKRLERRKDTERGSSLSNSNYNSLSASSSNSNSPVGSNIAQIVSNIPSNAISYNLGQTGAGTAIAVAASQAIAATQQLQQGRRTASLKASYEAINSSSRELSITKELQGAAHTALQAIHQDQTANKRNKKKWIGNLQSSSTSSSPTSSIISRSSPSFSVTSAHSQSMASLNASTNSQMTESKSFADSFSGLNNSEASPEPEWIYDPNEPRYCICNQVSYGDMVACDNADCPFEWFHYPCVGVTAPPKGKWYCPQCTSTMRKKSRKN